MSTKLCDKCEISLAYPVRDFPSRVDYRPVSNKTDNEILVRILHRKTSFVKGNKFIVLVDGSRYGIEIVNVNKQYVSLKQYFLHYNGDNLVPTVVRSVNIHNYI
jgi:hypothetical protein